MLFYRTLLFLENMMLEKIYQTNLDKMRVQCALNRKYYGEFLKNQVGARGFATNKTESYMPNSFETARKIQMELWSLPSFPCLSQTNCVIVLLISKSISTPFTQFIY